MEKQELHARIDRDFSATAVADGRAADGIEELRRKARELAHLIARLCPDSRERAKAINRTEEALTWAVAAIARNQPAFVSEQAPSPARG